MRTDNVMKALLSISIIILVALAIRPILMPTDAYSKEKTQYNVIAVSVAELPNEEVTFLKAAIAVETAEGWRHHTVLERRHNFRIVIFEK